MDNTIHRKEKIVYLQLYIIQRLEIMNKLTCILICCLWGWLSVRAQSSSPLTFTRIGLQEGLSQNTVLDIKQDKEGNIWMATQNGLNKYNGYEFTTYLHNESDSTSIGNDYIHTLKIDLKDRIWIGTNKGLSLYDLDKDRFYNFTLNATDEHTPVSHLAEMDSLHLLVVSEKKLYTFDIVSGTFQAFALPHIPEGIRIHSLSEQQDLVYIGTDKGLYLYSKSSKNTEKLPCKELERKTILAALQQGPAFLWIATEGNGLYRYDIQKKETKHYAPDSRNYLGSDYVRVLTLDSQNRLWVGTFTSLNIYDALSETFQSYTHDPADPSSLSQTSIRCIFKDKQEGMWLGTFFGGVNYYHPLKNRFQHLCRLPKANSLTSNVIGCITESRNRQVWIGTNGGINVYNPQTEEIRHYTTKNGLKSNDIKAIYLDEEHQTAYIGTHAGGLSILHIPNGRIETITRSQFKKEIKSVYALYPHGEDKLWLGTSKGITCFDKRNKTFADSLLTEEGHLLQIADVQYFLKDSSQRLWVGCKEGLYVFQETSQDKLERLRPFPADHPLNSQCINDIYEYADNTFYVGTRNGLFRIKENTQEIDQYTLQDGLPSNVVFGIEKDSYGKLWISTEKGLSCFTPTTENFKNFTANGELPSTQFTLYAHCHTSDGRMYFGGVNGLTVFYPDALTENPYIPSPIFTELRLFNKEVRPNDATGILKRHICHTDHITLRPGQSMFSISFMVPNYIAGGHNTFAYTLEGYDKEWYQTQTQRTVSYSNLPEGTYRFLVKAANNDGKWNDTPAVLEIQVLPVWYRTWWATLLFILIGIGGAYFILRYFWTQKIMKAQIEMERVDKERQKEVNEMKLRFFINISHELRTPLTLILAPLQDLLAKINDRWERKQLELIRQNTNRLLHLVNQLMDYRRAELGVFQLRVRRVPIYQIVSKNFRFYERIAQHKQIKYDFYSDTEGKNILCDPEYVELIENNLLSNAFKYTDEGKSITVSLKEEDNQLILQVADTGKGIPQDKQSKIFERFYQANDSELGSGIGLSLVQRLVELHHGRIELTSQEGEGSSFTVYLPTNADAYKPEETADEMTSANKDIHTTNPQIMYTVDIEDTAHTDNMDANANESISEGHRKEHILIVEDNADIRQYLAEELGKTYSVWQAENGEKALTLLKKQDIDLVLTDVMMPGMDGLQLCKHIKQNLSTCHIPVIILSAKADVKEQLEGLQVGADDYMPKPFVLNVMTAKIKNLFRTRQRVIERYTKSIEIDPEKMAFNPMDEDLLKRAKEIVEKHIDDANFTTDEFAREMLMSRSNLHLKMKALTGESTNDFIRKVRFNKACKLLREGKYTVSEVSAMVGFNTPSYFTTSFKKYFGCLPTEYGK